MACYRLSLPPSTRLHAGGSAPSRSSAVGDGSGIYLHVGNRSRIHHANPVLRFICSSVQQHKYGNSSKRSCSTTKPSSSPIDCDDRLLRSTLASSLLSHHMQTPQGQSLLAMAHHSLPLTLISQSASQQLELLVATASPPSNSAASIAEYAHIDRTLHRRTEEMKERQTNKAVQEIVYALVASRLLYTMLAHPQEHTSHLHRPMLAMPKLIIGQQDATIMQQLQQCHGVNDRLQAILPPEVQPLTAQHVAMVLYGNGCAKVRLEPNAFAQVDRFEMGKIYAASVMHGYFLARVCQRFQLDRSLLLNSLSLRAGKQVNSKKPSLEDYMKGDAFHDARTLRQMCSISSFYTLEVIEHHCAALFGELSFHSRRATGVSNDLNTNVSMHLSLVTSLLYQALAFGFLLWDVEHNFTSLYPQICGNH